MNITRNWKPFIAVGCSHAHHIDPVARASVIKFANAFIPPKRRRKRDYRIDHLGDYCDFEAFMSEGAGKGEPIAPDVEEGLNFLEELGVTTALNGNHEDRLWKLAHSSNEVVAECASMLKGRIEKHAKRIGAKLVPYTGVFQQEKFGVVTESHGTVFNEQATRDMGEIYVECDLILAAHTHCPGLSMARTTRRTISINVGTLKRYGMNDYSKCRRKSLSWGQAICYGEFCDDMVVPNLYVQPLSATLAGQEWRLPY